MAGKKKVGGITAFDVAERADFLFSPRSDELS
jgi:hypothetical protein